MLKLSKFNKHFKNIWTLNIVDLRISYLIIWDLNVREEFRVMKSSGGLIYNFTTYKGKGCCRFPITLTIRFWVYFLNIYYKRYPTNLARNFNYNTVIVPNFQCTIKHKQTLTMNNDQIIIIGCKFDSWMRLVYIYTAILIV